MITRDLTLKDNPERLLIGAVDPFSSKVWSGITGKQYEPVVDQWGGASHDTYGNAEAAGIATKDGKKMQDAAHAIAAFYTGKWASGLGGSGTGSETGSAGGAAGGKSPMNFMGMPGMGGSQAPAPQMNARYVPTQVDEPQQPRLVSQSIPQDPDEHRKAMRARMLVNGLMTGNGTS